MSDADAIARLEARVQELESTVDELRAGDVPTGRSGQGLPKPPLNDNPDPVTGDQP